MSNQEPYCGDIFQKIAVYYHKNIYVNITIPTRLVGMILNLLNLLVFTRKTMNSPPNLILAHLAFVDFIALLLLTEQYWMMYIQPKSDFVREQSYALTMLYWYTDIFGGTVQFISACLTVQLAAWRYIAVVHPLKERHWCTKKITRNVVITGYLICCVLFAIPYHLSFNIETSSMNGKPSYRAIERDPIMFSIKGIVYGVMAKILPSLVLAGLTSRIVVVLLARKTHCEQLSPSANTRRGMKNVETRQKTHRSTAILLAVAALFFVSEFPRGMLWLLRTINERDWGMCYISLGHIFMQISDINTSITFMVYYTLSQQFRTTFKSLFNLNKRTTPIASGNTEDTESGKTSQV
ncbi:sex peptide receptor-like [Planococcus citri]|uniref:sex peptide receptor-like n=1 Tax=Planococcus citri TaxID=170843 RepID=UPI0031F74A51